MAAFVFTLPLAVAAAGPAVTVAGRSDCPAAPDVQQAMAEAGVGASSSSTLGGLHLDVGPAETVVTVLAPDGRVLAQRQLSGALSCGERAQAAALLALTWETASTGSSPLEDVAVPVAPRLPESAPAALGPKEPQPSPVLRLGLGALGVAGVAPSGGPGVGLALDAVYRPTPRFGVRGELFGLWPREVSVGAGGDARYRRLGLGVGALLRRPWGWGAAQFDAGLVLAHTLVKGEASSQAWLPGLRLGAGVDVPLGASVHVALELLAVGWSRAETVVDEARDASQRLPRVDVLLRLSLNWEKNVAQP